MNLRQLLNRPKKPKPKSQLLLARSHHDQNGYCIVLMEYHNQHRLLHNTDEINKHDLYQCYSPDWHGHDGYSNEINHAFCKLYDTPSNKFWNIQGRYLTVVPPEEFPYKKFLEYKDIEKEIKKLKEE